jgi:hypothetical protein
MLKHIKLTAVIVALLALTADTALSRGGARSGRANNGFGGSVSVHGYYRDNGTYVAPYTRNSPGTGGSKSSGRTNAVMAGQTVATPIVPTRTLTSTTGTMTTLTNTSSKTPTATTASTAASPAPVQPTVTTNPLTVSPYLAVPLNLSPDASAQRTYGPILHNAKQLIKAGLYGPAAGYLRRIINGAPGTRIAAEAQRLLAALP